MAPIGSTRAIISWAAASHFRKSLNITTCTPSTFLSAGVGRVALIRHGNTAPSPNGVDFERQLTDVGRMQAKTAGSSYGANLLRPFHPLALCSPAPRCVETARIFLDASSSSSSSSENRGATPDLDLAADLYDGTMQPEGSRLFRKIGYAPLREYLEDPDDVDRKAALDVLGGYARVALDAMRGAVASGCPRIVEEDAASTQQDDERNTLLLFAHAIYLPAAALGLAEVCGCNQDSIDLVLSTNTKEAEGYLIDIFKHEVSLLVHPEEQY